MRKTATLCAIALIVLIDGLVSHFAAAADEPKLPLATFHEIVQKLIDAENNQDAAAMAALFSEDAILLPPGAEQPIQGKVSIRRFLDDYAKRKMDNHTITPTVLMLGGPQSMIEAGTWSGDVPAKQGAQATHETGTYLSVGILVDGKWKLWATSWQGRSDTGGNGSSALPQVSTSPDK
jgi:uncharacterized protein (TIGR02246 family)